jgi:hypothetical protein
MPMRVIGFARDEHARPTMRRECCSAQRAELGGKHGAGWGRGIEPGRLRILADSRFPAAEARFIRAAPERRFKLSQHPKPARLMRSVQ